MSEVTIKIVLDAIVLTGNEISPVLLMDFSFKHETTQTDICLPFILIYGIMFVC